MSPPAGTTVLEVRLLVWLIQAWRNKGFYNHMKALVTSTVALIGASAIGMSGVLSTPTNFPGVDLTSNSELSAYAAQFTECDLHETFGGVPAAKLTMCGEDPNNLQVLERHKSGAIRFVSKLSLDLDGGWKACEDPGPTDLCPTTYVYENWRQQDGAIQVEHWQEAFVSSDAVPYIVIPYARYTDDAIVEDKQFRQLTGVSIGDVGVVIHNELILPVLVADGGPHNKIGEGSIALFENLGQSRCLEWTGAYAEFCSRVLNWSFDGSVETYIFPGSKIDALTPENTNQLVSEAALQLYQELILNQPTKAYD